MKDFIEYITKAGFTDIKTLGFIVNATFEDLAGNKIRYNGITAVIPKMPM